MTASLPSTMRAARLYAPGPVVIEEIPTPKPGPGEILLQVMACGVCGSDVHITVEKSQFLKEYPRTPGHESSGVVAAVGEGVLGWGVGDRAAVWCGVACRECRACREGDENLCENFRVLGYDLDGAYAEYMRVPTSCLIPLDDRVPFEIGAILSDAVSTPYYALAVRGGLKAGETVAVFGCGGLGLHAVLLAKMLGSVRVFAVDVREEALERAAAYGADVLIRADLDRPYKAIREATSGRGVDLAIELVGRVDSIEEGSKCLAHRGRLVLVGIGRIRPRMPLIEPFVAFSHSILGSFGARKEDLARLVEYAAEGKLDLSRSISALRPLEELNDCLEDLHQKRGDPVRIVIQPNHRPVVPSGDRGL
ncbi:MAG: alcohol dehydrogenase catalytic domain-containing protein [Candidatus Omnitrophica bacterium]|nr:alcohol dehydrogenase [bacterium]NUN96052.1 alcohol dehydrogenase catalytic domain-containing protein [Candidatus Omnitrophota bacterium]